MHISELTIQSVRCFETAHLALRHAADDLAGSVSLPNVTLLLGNNGAGKTTVLKSIAMAILSPVLRDSGFVPYNLVRRVPRKTPGISVVGASCLLHWQDLGERKPSAAVKTHSFQATITRKGDLERLDPQEAPSSYEEALYEERSPAFLLLGYGATRRVPTEEDSRRQRGTSLKRRRVRYQRVAGLFEEEITLTPLSEWLPDLQRTNKGQYSQVVKLLDDLLPEECTFSGETTADGAELVFLHRGISPSLPR